MDKTQGGLTADELLVGNLVAATVAECEAHDTDASDYEKDAAADRFIKAKGALLRALRTQAAREETGPAAAPIAYALKEDLDHWLKADHVPVRLYRVPQRDDAGCGDLYEQCALTARLVPEPTHSGPGSERG